MRILGLMTGTSCDALDGSVLEFKGNSWKFIKHFSNKYPLDLRKKVFKIQSEKNLKLKDLLNLDRDIGIWIGNCVKNFIEKSKTKIDCIALHGQTIGHFPFEKPFGTTLQIGSPFHVSNLSGLTVINSFRNSDISQGGHGAPLSTLFHMELIKKAKRSKESIVIHNLGGFSNISLFSKKIISFDTGPGNTWIDQATRLFTNKEFDTFGEIARNSEPDLKAVDKILFMNYFKLPPPKSTGIDDFPFDLLIKNTNAKKGDLVRTATEITIKSIVKAYDFIIKEKKVKEIWLSGGGARNKYLVERLKEELKPLKIFLLEDKVNIKLEAIEGAAFAFLGFRAIKSESISGPWTGIAEGKKSFPQITPGNNFKELLSKF